MHCGPSGRVLVSRRTSVQFCFGSPLSSKVMVSGHHLVTFAINLKKKKMSLVTAHLNEEVVLMVTV